MRDRVFAVLSLYLFGWPVACGIWGDTYETTLDCLVLQLYCLVLAFTAAVYVLQCGASCYCRLLAVSLAIAGVAFVVSVDYLPALTALRGGGETKDFEYLGRATGFYFQPNSAAYAVIYLWTGLIPTTAKMSRWKQIGMLALLGMLVALTASRGGVAVAGITGVLFIVLTIGSREPGIAATAGMALVGIMLLLCSRHDLIVRATYDTPFERVANLAGALLNGDSGALEQDGSFRDRVGVQAEYLSECYSRPLGFGAGAVLYHQAGGGFAFTTHSYYISTAYEYGLPALGMYLYLIGQLHRVLRDKPLLAIILVPMILSGFFYASIFTLRVLPVIIGGHLAASLSGLREERPSAEYIMAIPASNKSHGHGWWTKAA